ncbi:MAG TPA: PKD domain-containing protein, partial [Thermoplasmata archaeon]
NLTVTSPGTYQYGVVVRDSSGQEFAQIFQVVAAAPPIPALLGVILAAPTTGEAPLPVTFSALASGGTPPYSYAWSFGDYSTSVEASPTHDYPASGTFTVTCNVSDMSMQTVHRTVVVTVTDSVWVVGQADATTGTATLNVLFAGQAGGGVAPYGFSWQFGDGGSSANENATHAYSAAGDYSAVLTVADALGHRADWSTKIHVDAAPVQPVQPVTNSTPSASLSPQLVTLGAELVIGAVVVTAIVVFVPRRRR